MPDALLDANPPPLSRFGTGWGVPEGNCSGGVNVQCTKLTIVKCLTDLITLYNKYISVKAISVSVLFDRKNKTKD